MSNEHNILSKLDRALAAYLISAGAGTSADVYPAKRSADKKVPCTICYCQTATVSPPFSGNWEVGAAIMVKTNAATDVDEDESDTPATAQDRVALTWDAFFDQMDSSGEKLADLITAAARATGDSDLATFTVLDVMVKEQEAGFDPKGNAWVDTLDLVVVCCSADVE